MDDEALERLLERVAASPHGVDALAHLELIAKLSESAGRVLDAKLAAHVVDYHRDDGAVRADLARLLAALRIPETPDDVEGLAFVRRVARAIAPVLYEELGTLRGELAAMNDKVDQLVLQQARVRRRRRRRRP